MKVAEDLKAHQQSNRAKVDIDADSTQDPVMAGGLSIRVRKTDEDSDSLVKQGSLISQKGGDLTPRGMDQPQNQLEILIQELGRIEVQQNKLRDAVKHNKGIVIHPRQEVLQEEEDPDTPKPPTPKKIIVSGGLTGFGIAEDLLRIDFSTPEEAPEEYKAVAFYEEPKKTDAASALATGLSGSFGLCDPASKEMGEYLERLEIQQRKVLELITGKKEELKAKYSGKPGLLPAPVGKELKPQRSKSRLSKTNNRLAATEKKEALSEILGVPRPDANISKGALAQKLPVPTNQIIAHQQAQPIIANNVMITMPASATRVPKPAPKPRPVFKQPYKVAQVQRSDEAKKEHQEISSEFAMALPGSTPSTQHLAKKKQPVAEVESASPYYSESPQADARPLEKTSRFSRGQTMPNEERKSKSIIKGFRKLLSRN